MSSKTRISKFLGAKGQRQIARAKAVVLATSLPKPSVRSLDRRIKKINRSEELSHNDSFLNNTTFNNTGTVTVLSNLAQGDNNITRHGSNVSCTSIQWRLRFAADVDSIAPTIIRHMIFWDAQPNGATPVVAEVLDASVITALVFAPYHSDFQKRFKILYDKTMVLNPLLVSDFDPATGTTTTVAAASMIDRGKRKLSRVAKYDTNTGTITDIQSNSLISLLVSNQAGQDPTVIAGYRMYFKDY